MKNEVLYIWFQQAVGFCNKIAKEALEHFDNIADAYNCDDFSFLGDKREKYIKRLESKDISSAFETLKKCEQIGVRVTGYYDEFYPSRLRKIDTPPAVLYSIGKSVNLNDLPCIAIVGTRKMSDYGKNIAEGFAYNFSKSGAVVVSGLAKGVDTAAHRGAIMADGFTVAVLGNPIGDIYPKENIKAFMTLYERGLVISEMYPGAPRTRADFPNRNRIISGLCDSVVIAEAGENSGALITARHAITQGKAVYAVPGAIGAENMGTNKLIKQGVPVAIEPLDVIEPLMLEYPEQIRAYEPSVTSKLRSYGNVIKPHPDKVVDDFADDFKTEQMSEVEPSDTSAMIKQLLASGSALTADEIVAKSGIPISEVMTELTMLEICGDIISNAGGRFSAVKE